MWALLLALPLALEAPREGEPLLPSAPGEVTPAEALEPLDTPRPSAHPLSIGLFEPRPPLSTPFRIEPFEGPTPRPVRDPLRDPLDLDWLIAPKRDPFAPPRAKPEIDPYDFSAPAPTIEVRTSTWSDPYRQRDLHQSLWELRERNGVNLRVGVSRSDCWWR